MTRVPTPTNPHLIRIEQPAQSQPLTKEQRRFNTLIKQIDTEKQSLRQWQTFLPEFNALLSEKFVPLQATYDQRRMEWVHLLDAAYDRPDFKKGQRRKLKHLILESVYELGDFDGNEALSEIYAKYADKEADVQQQEDEAMHGELVREMFAKLFGEEATEHLDFSTPENLQDSLGRLHAEHEADRERHEARRQKRKKTSKQLEKEAREREEAQNVSKSIQEVYRKLAAALHPDREPDPVERDRKTEVMQRVNVAYGKRDLLQLLELQLEVEQIDQTHLNRMAADRLVYFNKILAEQLRELRAELFELHESFRGQMQLSSGQLMTPTSLMRLLKRDIKDLRAAVAHVEAELQSLQDPDKFKLWLKQYRIPDPDDEFDPFLDDLSRRIR